MCLCHLCFTSNIHILLISETKGELTPIKEIICRFCQIIYKIMRIQMSNYLDSLFEKTVFREITHTIRNLRISSETTNNRRKKYTIMITKAIGLSTKTYTHLIKQVQNDKESFIHQNKSLNYRYTYHISPFFSYKCI